MANQKKAKLRIIPQEFDLDVWFESSGESIEIIAENGGTGGRATLMSITDDGQIFLDVDEISNVNLRYG